MIKLLRLFFLLAAALISSSCNSHPKDWKKPNMTTLTSRLKPVFEKSKTVCFGRFMIDVPESTTIVWGNSIVPYDVTIFRNDLDKMKGLAQAFIDELKATKAINHDDVPLLLSIDNVKQPEGNIVVGYEDFEAINGLKINGYFRLDGDGVIINARPLKDEKDETIADIIDLAQRLRQRTENEIPNEPGNCIEHAFLVDKPNPTHDDLLEHIRIGFRLKEFPDAHLSIYVAPTNPSNPEGDSLQEQWKRIKEDPATPEEKKALGKIRYFRESPRQIHDWKTGYEVLLRNPDEKGVHSYHDFELRFTGVPHDPYKPYADIQFQTGVADNTAGATKPSLTDEEAIAVWDKITSTIRVRPTSATPAKTAGTDPRPHIPLGELAATGRTCPQTGWWVASEPENIEGGQRQHIKAGERMPYVIAPGEPSLWQKLTGERPSYRTAAVWKLVAYGDAPAPTVAQTSPQGSQDENPDKKG